MIPRAKEYKKNEGSFSLPLVLPDTKDGNSAALVLSRFLPALSVKKGADANVKLITAKTEKKGEYTLKVTPSDITASYGDFEGLRNALATLASLYTDEGFSACEISDAPSYHFRSVLLDLARGYVELPVLREHLVRMAYLKYNYAHLHLMDAKSYVMESEVVPNVEGYRQYTRDELRELCAFCAEMGIEIIPEIEFPTHTRSLIKALPELACDIIDSERAREIISVPNVIKSLISDDGSSSTWAICIGNDRTYEIYDRIIKEVCEVFSGEYIHVGGDEIAYPHLGAVPNWDNCHVCRARMKEKGISDTLALYHDGFCRLYEVAAKYGKRMIKWNEQEELATPPAIPREIIIEYWKPSVAYFVKETDPALIRSEMKMLRDAGFDVFNAHFYYTYNDENSYMTAEKMNAWTPDRDSLGLMGGETCAWELGNPRYAYYAHRLPFGMALFADRVWNRDTVPYDDAYRADLFASALGKNGLGSLPLSPIPAILSPIPHSRAECIQPEPEHAPAALEAIADVKTDEIYAPHFLTAYRDYLRSLIDHQEKNNAPVGEAAFGEAAIKE
ncbi:MAG: hypothetical protein E7587_05845 [Ruminococcaceae bacterium]|nr:hypothetical protein [Oscillospiraceae bacterium]